MERRDFLKISVATGAVTALEGCGNPDHQLIRFVPEEVIFPGIATWKPSICTLCPAGCGMLVRVMLGEAEVVRRGQTGILKMGLAKKLEGNPAHPISQGRLCPRGQAGLQITYHPDRIKNPMQRTGPRGSGQFQEISWDDAIKQLVSHLTPLQADKTPNRLAFLTSPLRGQRAKIVQGFADAFGKAPVVQFAFFHDSFGNAPLPTLDLARSNYVISFGADFLGTWNSPVAQSVGFGQMRNGRPGQRGKFVHVEPRMSLTAASADEWIPAKPGMEGALALSIAHVILSEKLLPTNAASREGSPIDGWLQGLPDYAPEKIASQIGISAETISRIAHEAAANSPAVAIIGGAAIAYTNGSFNALAVDALNSLLDSVGKPGGISFTPAWQSPATEKAASSQGKDLPFTLGNLTSLIQSTPDAVKVLLLHDANPVFAVPPAMRVRETLEKVPFIASFGSFIDETSILSDLILPDHSPIESWLDDSPPSGSTRTVVSLAQPAMKPLHNTRSMPDVLLDVAHQLGGDVSATLPWKTYDEALKTTFAALYKDQGAKSAKDADEFWSKALDQGGWWSAEENHAAPAAGKASGAPVKITIPQFDGSPDQFPFHFLPFASQMFYDGSLAHLPWMQEAPDPLSTVMWGTWIEINTQTASKLGIKQGDQVEVASQHGKLQAPAMVIPAIAPDVIAMPIGQGHENFTRYATGRGANPISILAPMPISDAGGLAWAATRVKISRVGEGKMILYGGSLVENPPENRRR